MFENENRYIAKSVGGRIHLDVQIFIWQAIEWLKNEGEELDYLQVFNISVASEINHTLRIVHSQEVPEYKKIWSIKVSKPCYDEKLFVIYIWWNM